MFSLLRIVFTFFQGKVYTNSSNEEGNRNFVRESCHAVKSQQVTEKKEEEKKCGYIAPVK